MNNIGKTYQFRIRKIYPFTYDSYVLSGIYIEMKQIRNN